MDGVGMRETRKAGGQGPAGTETRASSSSSAEGASSYMGVPGQGQGPGMTGSGDRGITSTSSSGRAGQIVVTDVNQQHYNIPPILGMPPGSLEGNMTLTNSTNNHEGGGGRGGGGGGGRGGGGGIGVGGTEEVPTFGGGLLRRQHSLDPNHIDCLSSSGEICIVILVIPNLIVPLRLITANGIFVDVGAQGQGLGAGMGGLERQDSDSYSWTSIFGRMGRLS